MLIRYYDIDVTPSNEQNANRSTKVIMYLLPPQANGTFCLQELPLPIYAIVTTRVSKKWTTYFMITSATWTYFHIFFTVKFRKDLR